MASAIHVDSDIASGMNWFDPNNPTRANGDSYGNTSYGNVAIKGGKVTYTPVTTQWGSFDEFYIFGNTWRATVMARSTELRKMRTSFTAPLKTERRRGLSESKPST